MHAVFVWFSLNLYLPLVVGWDLCGYEAEELLGLEGVCVKTELNLTQIPDDIPTNTTYLDLGANKLTTLHTNSFAYLPDLKEITLALNPLSEIETGAFNQLSKLENLELAFTKLVELRATMWQGLTNLKVLDLRGNQITRVEDGCFRSLNQLQKLLLSGNTKIGLRTEMFAGLHNLKELLVVNVVDQGEELVLDQDLWGQLGSLEELSLLRNNIKLVPSHSFQCLGKLESLWLDYNKLSNIEADMWSGLTSLKSLSISNNWLATLTPGCLSPLTSLEELTLNNNYISSIHPSALSGLSHFKMLNLKYNSLTTFGSDVFNPDDFPDSNGHPASLTLEIRNNQFNCDEHLCWLKEGTNAGWLKYKYRSPKCENYPDLSWDRVF